MRKLVFVFFLNAFLGCPHFAQSKATNEDYKIYTVILKEIYKENLRETKQKVSIVILDKTVKPKFFDDYDNGKTKGLSEDFGRKNKTTINLERKFSLKYKIYVVSKNKLDRLFEIGDENAESIRRESKKDVIRSLPNLMTDMIWKPFYEKFPEANGYYSFSRIGFSSTKRFAVLQVYGLGDHWSSDLTYILVKTKKGWNIHKSLGSFIIA